MSCWILILTSSTIDKKLENFEFIFEFSVNFEFFVRQFQMKSLSDLVYFIWKLIFNIYAVVLEAYGEDGDETTTTPIYADVVEREDEGMYHHLHFIFHILQ